MRPLARQLPELSAILRPMRAGAKVLAAGALVFVISEALIARDLDPITKNHYRASDLEPFLKATEWTIFSLSPGTLEEEEAEAAIIEPAVPPGETKPRVREKEKIAEPKPKPPPDHVFHDHRILGQTKVTVTPELKTVITTLDEAGRHWNGAVAACFFPRHGIRVTVDGETCDLLICYECMGAEIFRGEKSVGEIAFATDLRLMPRPAFLNGALVRAKVRLPPPPRH